MNAKILVVLLLGISFLFFGCVTPAEEQVTPVDEIEEEETTEEETEEVTEEETTEEEPETEEQPTGEVSDEELADLFQIDEDEPLGDTGLDGAQTPSSEKEQTAS